MCVCVFGGFFLGGGVRGVFLLFGGGVCLFVCVFFFFFFFGGGGSGKGDWPQVCAHFILGKSQVFSHMISTAPLV